MTFRREIPYLVGLIIGLVVLVGAGFVDVRQARAGANEFGYFWAGARTLVDGGDPYRPDDWLRTLATYGIGGGREPYFIYAPWTAVALVPLALLPLRSASDIWTVAGILLAVAAVRSLLRAVAPSQPVVHTLAGMALFASQPGITTFWSGQWSFVLLGALAAATAASIRGGSALTAAGAALLAKPHLFLFALWGIVRAQVAKGRRAAAAALVAMCGAIVLASLALVPQWWTTWPAALTGARYSTVHPPTTLAQALLDTVGAAGPAIAALAVLVAVVVGLLFDPAGDAALAVWPAISLMSAVYAFSYDHLALLVPLVVAAGVVSRRSRRRANVVAAVGLGWLLLGPTLLYEVATERSNESVLAFVPLAVLVLVVVALWDQRGARTPDADVPPPRLGG